MVHGTIYSTQAYLQELPVLLNDFAKYLKSNPESSIRVALYSGDSEDSAMPTIEPTVVPNAEVVEGTGMAPHEVGRPDGTRFTHFLDGIQDARRIGFYGFTVPIVYGYIGAVIRRRGDDRRMCTHDKVSKENLYFSFAHLDPAGLRKSGMTPRDAFDKDSCGDSNDPLNVHPLKLQEIARRMVSNDRAELERDLAKAWVASCGNDDWLFWDGSITSSKETSRHPRVIGVIKSHQTQYFGAEDQRKILSLRVGERSSVFQPRGRDWTPVYSWYLRLHTNEGRDPYFGLVRIEAAPGPETITMADEISRWLLGEKSPLALPDGRWDRMLYPIRDCEQYLRSIAPSKAVIAAALAGL